MYQHVLCVLQSALSYSKGNNPLLNSHNGRCMSCDRVRTKQEEEVGKSMHHRAVISFWTAEFSPVLGSDHLRHGLDFVHDGSDYLCRSACKKNTRKLLARISFRRRQKNIHPFPMTTTFLPVKSTSWFHFAEWKMAPLKDEAPGISQGRGSNRTPMAEKGSGIHG